MKAFQAGAVLPTLAAILAFGAADAAAREWVVVEQLGTVLQLTDDSWKEVERGSRFVDGVVIRTLQRGQLQLEAGPDRISIGRDTVVEVLSAAGSDATSINQHAGVVTLAVRSAAPDIQLLAPGLSVAPSAGVVVVRVNGDTTQVAVTGGGEAVVTDRGSGRAVAVASGGAVTGSGGGGMTLAEAPTVEGGGPSGPPPGSGPPSDSGAGSAPGASGAAGGAGSGSGNAGGNPGGGGGNAGGNSGGAGGNSGGGGNAGGNSGGGGNGGNSGGGGNPGGNSGGGGGPPPGAGGANQGGGGGPPPGVGPGSGG